jgi:predicted lipoprotein with Yx(FWY)xxD motif
MVVIGLRWLKYICWMDLSMCDTEHKSSLHDKKPTKMIGDGDCSINWPPLLVDKNATSYGSYSIITRDDGKSQFAYKGKPLYYFSMDKKPDERNGDGYSNNAWHIVKM